VLGGGLLVWLVELGWLVEGELDRLVDVGVEEDAGEDEVRLVVVDIVLEVGVDVEARLVLGAAARELDVVIGADDIGEGELETDDVGLLLGLVALGLVALGLVALGLVDVEAMDVCKVCDMDVSERALWLDVAGLVEDIEGHG